MNLQGFYHCCGANILYDLSLNSFNNMGIPTKDSEKAFINQVKHNIQQSKIEHRGIILAITNLEQMEEGKLLKKCGFRRLKIFPNPNNGLMTLTLWGYDLCNPVQKISPLFVYPFFVLLSFINRIFRRE